MEGLNLDNIILDTDFTDNVENIFNTSTEEVDETKVEELKENNTEKETAEELNFNNAEEEKVNEKIKDTFEEELDLSNELKKQQGDKSSEKVNSDSPFPSLAKAFKEDGILSNLTEEELKKIKTGEDFSTAIENEVKHRLDEKNKRVSEALELGVAPTKIKQSEDVINYLESLTTEILEDETEKGVNLRSNLIVQDFLNKGFTQERAVKEAKKSIAAGTDLEDAMEALESNKEHYTKEYSDIINTAKQEAEEHKKHVQTIRTDIKNIILNEKEVFENLKLTDNIKKQAIESIQKPVFTDSEGNQYSAIQKYEKENPAEFMAKLGIIYTITDGFKNLEKITSMQKAKLKKSAISELESTLLNNSSLDNGNVSFANNLGSDDNTHDKGDFILDI